MYNCYSYSWEGALHLQKNASQVYDSHHGSQGKITESSNISTEQKTLFTNLSFLLSVLNISSAFVKLTCLCREGYFLTALQWIAIAQGPKIYQKEEL